MSTEHDVRVVRLGDVIKHPNADTLSITEVDGRPCVVKSGLWKPGDMAVYIPIDSMVPVDDERFSWLKKKPEQTGKVRIRASRLRGTLSMGILVPNEEGMSVGDEVSHLFGITVYEPPEELSNGEMERDPGFLPVYDIESLRKWGDQVLIPGEEVVITEKIHGANGRFAFHRDRLWCGSRTTFKKEGTGSMWWEVAERYKLAERMSTVPGIALYGEVYGQVQDLKYGKKGADLLIFDAYEIVQHRWLNDSELEILIEMLNYSVHGPEIKMCPILYRGPWSWENVGHLAEGYSVVAAMNGEQHVREGFVLRPVKERYDMNLGRVILKLHGEGYLTRKGG